MTSRHTARTARHRGFTLVELMVAMALGLITTLIIAQVLINSEGNRRTSIDGSDAQVNGSLGLFSLSRDLQMAGFGVISHSGVLGCPIKGQYGTATALELTLAPITISTDAAGNAVIRSMSAGRTGTALAMNLAADHTPSANFFTVSSTLGVSDGDVLLAVPKVWDGTTSWCTLYQTVAAAGSNELTDTRIPHEASDESWNMGSADQSPTSGYRRDDGFVINVGRLVVREYSVDNSNLVVRTLQPDGTWGSNEVLASGIVSMRALYGRDTSASPDDIVDVYDTTTPTTADAWRRVRNVRIALVARSSQREREDTDGNRTVITQAAPEWDVGAATTVSNTTACSFDAERQCLSLTIPAAADDTEWQQYRYKVYDTVVPLRNVLWSAS